MICVLDVIDGPACGKRIWVKENQCLEIGRISSADFCIPTDSHLSRRHMLLDSTQNGFRVRDVGSANGTFLNNQRITVHALRSGDSIRAGMTTFLVSLREDGENPHDEDGFSFSQSSAPNESVTVPGQETQIDPEPSLTRIRTLDFANNQDLESTVKATEPTASKSIAASKTIESQDLSLDLRPLAPANEDWWKSFFKISQQPNLFEQSEPFAARQGDFVGLLQKFSSKFQICLVINLSQLQPEGLKLLERLRPTGSVEALSKTLCFVSGDNVNDLWSLINLCLGQDAMVCLGSKRKLDLSEVVPFANSLSFPSMLDNHLRASNSKINSWLVKNNSFALFELDREGKIGLLI